MEIEIRTEPFRRTLHGRAGDVEAHDYAAAGMALMGPVWEEIRGAGLSHHGINHWVYDAEDRMFAGVELKAPPAAGSRLIERTIMLPHYAYWLHVGPYDRLGAVHQAMIDEIAARGLRPVRPSLDIFGHWTDDESKLETEVLIALATPD